MSYKLTEEDEIVIEEYIQNHYCWIMCVNNSESGKKILFHLFSKRYKVIHPAGDPVSFDTLKEAIEFYNNCG